MGTFKIKADRFEWIGGTADDPQDHCLHGHVTVQFGDTEFCSLRYNPCTGGILALKAHRTKRWL